MRIKFSSPAFDMGPAYISTYTDLHKVVNNHTELSPINFIQFCYNIKV
jgi:hypothetical protein